MPLYSGRFGTVPYIIIVVPGVQVERDNHLEIMNINNNQIEADEYFMRVALRQAKIAGDSGDVPVGAVIVQDNAIIAKEYNTIEDSGNPLAHAEINTINAAAKKLGYKHLLGCTMYVTLEPCAMCSGAIVLARIPYLVYGADDPKSGGSGSLYGITSDRRLNQRCEIRKGVLKEECSIILKEFFAERRR